MNFEDKIRFVSLASVLTEPTKELKEQAFASLDNLAAVFPEWAKKDEQPDLLHYASNLVYVGRRNLNGVCLPLDVARQIYKDFTNKLVDIEHQRKSIVGFITNCAFTKVDDNQVIAEKDLDSYEGDVYLSYSAVIWKVAVPKLTDLMVQASNPDSPKYNLISSSFELGSNGWDIAVGSEFVKNARIIKQGDKDFDKYKDYLVENKGSGKLKTGEFVYRNLKLDCVLPLGAGLVTSPASQVKGIFCLLEETEASTQEVKDAANIQGPVGPIGHIGTEGLPGNLEKQIKIVIKDIIVEATKNGGILQKNEENKASSEIPANLSVNTNNPIMKISKIEDIVASLFKEETVASDVTKVIADHIAKSSEDYVKQLNEQKSLSLAAKLEAENKIKELQTKISELANQLNKIEEEKATKQSEADFNDRMTAFDAEYDLDEDDRKALSQDIKACKNKDEFTLFVAKMKPLLKEKNKNFKKEKANKMQETFKAANVKVTVDEKTLDFKEIVASVQAVAQTALPNTPPPAGEKTLLERMQALKGNILFNGQPVK